MMDIMLAMKLIEARQLLFTFRAYVLVLNAQTLVRRMSDG
jgi:hypothetical protein